MKTVSVSGSPRESVGKKDAKALRRQGLIPCVLYGGKEQLNFHMEEKSFKDIIYTPNSYLLKLDINGKSFNAIIQDTQFHPVTDKIIHCDFLEVFPEKSIKIDIPINIQGSSPGVIKGGKLFAKLRKLRVKGLMDALPDQIDVNISKLEIGDSVKVNELITEGLEFLDNPTSVVIQVKTTRTVNLVGDEDDAEEGDPAAAGAEAAPAAE